MVEGRQNKLNRRTVRSTHAVCHRFAAVCFHARTQKERRAGKPVFDVVIELDGGDQPRWTVVTRVAAAVDELLLTGSVPKTEIRAPLPAENAVQEVYFELLRCPGESD